MKKGLRLLVFAFFAMLTVSISGCGYNSMQSDEEAVFSAWGDVESQYQKRSDLVPNLVATVKGAADFEKGTLTAVIEARSKATSIQLSKEAVNDPVAMENFRKAQGELSGALSRLMVSVEKYPELKANQNFIDLQSQLEGIENSISVSRIRYNGAVQDFNYGIRMFPNSLTNSVLLQLKPKNYFKADESAKQAPTVKF
ncbi:MAG: LemA family protein [Candidatus Moranbacteria bacterium]|nr:LemA family protein [Candidatus Moranbacteria bacterium]